MDGQIKGDSPEFGLPMIDSMNLLVWEPVPGMPSMRRPIRFRGSPGMMSGAAAGGLLDEAFEVDAHLFLNHAVVGFLLAAERIDES